jgi:hypothetical protein
LQQDYRRATGPGQSGLTKDFQKLVKARFWRAFFMKNTIVGLIQSLPI